MSKYFILLGILFITPVVCQGEEYYGPKKKIVIADFEVFPLKKGRQGDVTAHPQSGKIFTAQLNFALFHTNRFVVKDTKEGTQLLIRGKILKCGEVTAIKWYDRVLPARFRGPKVTNAWIVVEINLCNPNTGEIIKSFRLKGETELSGEKLAGIDNEKLESNWDSSALSLANNKVIKKIIGMVISEMDKYKWEARITRIEGDKIYIDCGLESSIKAGTMLAVHKKNHADTIVGEAKIIEVNKDFSIVLITKNSGIKPEMTVRMAE